MSAFRKLIIAAALMGTGLGVAIFLGEPAALKSAAESLTAAPAVSAAHSPLAASPVGTWMSDGAKLLPESPAVAPPTATAGPAPPPALFESHLAPISPITSEQAANPIALPANSTAVSDPRTGPTISSYSGSAPSARLRAEAPRPIGNEPRSPATIRRTPTFETADSDQRVVDPYKVNSNWASPQVLPVGYSSDANAPSAAATAYDVRPGAADSRLTAPPPWPATEEREEPQTHIVVDGDSLERLAGRYLADPHRGAEIFELNREVLANPDVLPLGVELKIPDRTPRTSWDRQSRLIGPPNGAVREAATGNLVPVRRLPAAESAVPRARLTGPVPVE